MGNQYSSKRESFHDAILKKDLKKVKYFIQNGLDVKNDLRALELATYRGSTDIVEYLLHRGCKPNNKRTARAFDIAVWKCHKEIAQLFLKAGIEYKGKNIYQETILFVAACSNNTALTEILIESGCDMNETTRYWSPLHAAAARNHEQTLETLLKHGCAVNIPDKDGLTALAYCIRNENIKCIKLLIKCGCKIDMDMINSTECLRTQLIKYPLIEKIFYEELTRVKSLQELARLRVRKCLDQRLISKVDQLPLPQKLKDYISMKEVFSNTKNSNSLTSFSISSTELCPSSETSTSSQTSSSKTVIINNSQTQSQQLQQIIPNQLVSINQTTPNRHFLNEKSKFFSIDDKRTFHNIERSNHSNLSSSPLTSCPSNSHEKTNKLSMTSTSALPFSLSKKFSLNSISKKISKL